MNTKQQNAYTSAPKRRATLFFGSLQLLFWLVFHPSAWQNHIARLDSSLPADLRLADLKLKSKRIQWQQPAWQRLLMIIYLIWPLAVNIIIGLVFYLWGGSGEEIAYGVAFAVVYGITIGLLVSTLISVPMSAVLATAIGVASQLMLQLQEMLIGVGAYGLTVGAAVAIALDMAKHGASYSFTRRMSGLVIAGLWLIIYMMMDIPVEVPILLVALISTLLGLTETVWRPVLLYPFMAAWNTLLYRADEARESADASLLRWHSAFWDEHQRLPLRGLEEHLLLVMERHPAEGQAAIEFLSRGHQRWAAQAAQIELDARRLERCADVAQISQASGHLAVRELPGSALLRTFSRISQDVQAASQKMSRYHQRLALSAVEERLDGLLRELTRSSERYGVRFRPIATSWRQIVADEIRTLADAAEQSQEIDNPYIFGVPLTTSEKIFVGRTDISGRIEQLLLDRRRPPLLLYGQRRMGKTSLLINLSRLLPSTMVLLFVDGQLISGANSYPDFLYNMAKQMIKSAQAQRGLTLPSLSRSTLIEHPFTCFNEWLDEVEQTLEGRQLALLALDEFEVLSTILNKEGFEATDLLRMLRHLIQHRPRFKVLLAGSHTLEEFQNWSSYLINMQVIKISYLTEQETRQLVEQPVKGFSLRYQKNASQRVYELTRGYPHLVQLLCYEIVELKNDQPPAKRRLASLADVEAAIPHALTTGSFFFADIERNQVDQKGVALLRYLAAQGEGTIAKRDTLAKQVPNELDCTINLLLRRDLIEPVDDGYRFQVELIRRWFARFNSGI